MTDTVVLPREAYTGQPAKTRWHFLHTPELGFLFGFIAGVVTLGLLVCVLGLKTSQQTNNIYFDVLPVFTGSEYGQGGATLDFNVCADTVRLSWSKKSSVVEDVYE